MHLRGRLWRGAGAEGAALGFDRPQPRRQGRHTLRAEAGPRRPDMAQHPVLPHPRQERAETASVVRQPPTTPSCDGRRLDFSSQDRRFASGRRLIPADGFSKFTDPEPSAPKRAKQPARHLRLERLRPRKSSTFKACAAPRRREDRDRQHRRRSPACPPRYRKCTYRSTDESVVDAAVHPSA